MPVELTYIKNFDKFIQVALKFDSAQVSPAKDKISENMQE